MPQTGTVVLVHGLWMHGAAMLLIKRRIARCGYRVTTYSYPTVRLDLDENAVRLAQYCEALNGSRVHLVAHSLGCLVAIRAAQLLPPSRLGRLVLLGPPLQDCYSARRVQRLPGGGSIIGRSIGQWLVTPRSSSFDALDAGVIAGNRRFGLGCLFAPQLPLPNDGVVSVEETRISGMRDHMVLGVTHSGMLISTEIVHQVCAFLGGGTFDRAREGAASVN